MDPVKLVKPSSLSTSPRQQSITDRSKTVILLWFLNITCCGARFFSNMEQKIGRLYLRFFPTLF